MVRYMLFLSYIGTRYRGASKQIGCEHLIDVDCVEGAIGTALTTFISPRSIIKPNAVISSRTDSGVHALFNTGVVELEHPVDELYDCQYLCKRLNLWFHRCGHEIQVSNILPISEDFDPRRSAKLRTYFYRFAVPKQDGFSVTPITEIDRTWIIRNPKLDIDAIRNALRLFSGPKNYGTFAARNRTQNKVRYVRTLERLSIEPAEPLMPQDPVAKEFTFWQLNISSRGFLYNQVRRILGTLISLGAGIINERDINIMLHVPAYFNYDTRIAMAPADGLYLKNIEYDPEELAACILKPQLPLIPLEQIKQAI